MKNAKKTHFTTVYSDISQNLTLLKFPVWVKETYSPVTTFRVDEKGNRTVIPPVRPVDEFNADAPCRANYSIQTIVDVIVNGHWIEFVNSGDVQVVRDMLKLYIKQVEATGIDMKTDVFFNNAKNVVAKMEGNLDQRNAWENIKNPRAVTIEALLAAL